jgi:ubiquinone/menaquinone biosynthesis C-methylase UbiE
MENFEKKFMTAKTLDGKVDLFGHEGQAKMYHEFRPKYTDEIVSAILSLVSEKDRSLYVDVACGSGQLTHLIAPSFRACVGIDQSFEQLGQAGVNSSNIEFKAGSAFQLPVENGSVDLITVAQALHWLLPYEIFFSEVLSKLKPGGVFAAVAYAFPVVRESKANEEVKDFYLGLLGADKSPGSQGCWWGTNRPTIDGFYSDIPFPVGAESRRMSEVVSMTVDHYMNYLRTLSAYRSLLESGAPDPLPKLEEKIRESANSGHMIEVEIPFFFVWFRKA